MPELAQEEQYRRQRELAHERARTDVAEVRRLVQRGAPDFEFFPLLDRIEADLNTIRDPHVGWAGYQVAADDEIPADAEPVVEVSPKEREAADDL